MRPDLTQREIRILEALADGANSKELACIIERSRGTVEAEVRGLFLKLSARSRHHLIAQAFRLGVLPVPDYTVSDVRDRESASNADSSAIPESRSLP